MGEEVSGLSEAQREQIKLRAAYMNGVAIGLVMVGGLSIPTAILLNADNVLEQVIAAVFALGSAALSPYLHLEATRILKRLDNA